MPLTKAEITRLRGLHDKRTREAEGLYVVEGPKVVAELLAQGVPLRELYVTPACPPLDPGRHPARLVRVDEAEMERISHFPTPSCVLAVGAFAPVVPEPGEWSRGLTLGLDGVQDAGNVGTLLRLADWFGVARVLLSPECADLFSQKVINASMGSFARVRALRQPLEPALDEAAAAGVPILGCDLEGRALRETPARADAIVLIGSEGRGLSPGVIARLTDRVTIPRHGRAESLNAAVAAGIVLAHLRG